MRKIFTLIAFVAAMLTATTASAQEDKMLFNHLSVGLDVGTTGWGLEVATPCTPYVTFRAGFATVPSFSYTYDKDGGVKYKNHGVEHRAPFKGTLHKTDFTLLADLYPIKGASFHFTVGFFAGRSDFVTAKNTAPLVCDPGEGLEINDGEIISPDANGNAKARIKVNGFKPYLGIGFGRSISTDKKFNVSCDLGVQFWGKPKLQAYKNEDLQLDIPGHWTEVLSGVDDEDFNDALDIVHKVKVWPTMTIRFIYNIF